MRRIIAIILTICLLIGQAPLSAYAIEADSGKCGDNLTWDLNEEGVLTITGTGAMYNKGYTPWNDYINSITKVIIGEGVTFISNHAFHYCINLKRIFVNEANQYYSSDERGVLFDKNQTVLMQAPGALEGEYSIPDTVTTVNDNSFNNCDKLTAVSIGKNVQTLGDSAFGYCDGLKTVNISASVVEIGANCFADCDSLQMFHVDAANMYYTSDNRGVLFNKSQTELMQAPCMISGTYTIPDTVLTIADKAFSNCDSLNGIDGGNHVTTIGQDTFSYCNELYSVTISDSVTSTDYYSFAYCKKLQEVHLGNGLSALSDSMFRGCTGLVNIEIPSTVHTIEHAAFSGCSSLKNLVIPASVSVIGDGAFALCSGLASVKFLGDAPVMPDTVFGNTDTTAYYPEKNPTWTSEVLKNYAGTVTWVPYGDAGVIASGWSGHTIWKMNSNGTLSFHGEGNMRNYDYGEERPWDSYADQIKTIRIEVGVTSVGECAFKGLTNVETVVFPKVGLNKIGEAAFYGCTSLKEISIPDSVYTIWAYTFKNCSQLKNIRWPVELVKIDQGAFENCVALEEIYLPGEIEIIGAWSFKGCTGLKEADMEWTNATEIRESAFKNCSALKSILLPAKIQVLGDSCFYGIGAERFDVPETITEVKPWCFARSSLKAIVFEGNAPSIGEGAFNKITLTAYYNGDDATWTEDVRLNYGGTVTWKLRAIVAN